MRQCIYLILGILLLAQGCSEQRHCPDTLPMLTKPIVELQWRFGLLAEEELRGSTTDTAILSQFREVVRSSEVEWRHLGGGALEWGPEKLVWIYADGTTDSLRTQGQQFWVYQTPDRLCVATLKGPSLEEFRRFLEDSTEEAEEDPTVDS